MTTIEFEVAFESDWHIGTGVGHFGHLDRTYARDEDGLPFIPAKSIVGLLRLSMSQIVHGLDSGASGPWHRASEWLLGSEPNQESTTATFRESPRPAHLHVGRAMISSELASVLTSRAELKSSLSVVRPGVKLSELGTALDRHLRFTEMAPAGLVLKGSCSLPDGTPDGAVALVVGALENIRAIGHGRRRGGGRCQIGRAHV